MANAKVIAKVITAGNSEYIVVPRRIYHWINLISIAVLAFTGWYIHAPFATDVLKMGMMQSLHFIFVWVFTINFGLRLWFAFFGKAGDWKVYLKPWENNDSLAWTLRHYLLFQPCPGKRKCRVLQRASYVVIALFYIVQIVSGFQLYWPDNQTLSLITVVSGGLAMVRKVHLLLMWFFVSFAILHTYIAVTYEFGLVKHMFFGVPNEE